MRTDSFRFPLTALICSPSLLLPCLLFRLKLPWNLAHNSKLEEVKSFYSITHLVNNQYYIGKKETLGCVLDSNCYYLNIFVISTQAQVLN